MQGSLDEWGEMSMGLFMDAMGFIRPGERETC